MDSGNVPMDWFEVIDEDLDDSGESNESSPLIVTRKELGTDLDESNELLFEYDSLTPSLSMGSSLSSSKPSSPSSPPYNTRIKRLSSENCVEPTLNHDSPIFKQRSRKCTQSGGGISFLGDEASVYQGSVFSSVFQPDRNLSPDPNIAASSLGGIHHPAADDGRNMIPVLLGFRDYGERLIHHWVIGSVYGGSESYSSTEILPFEVRGSPIHDLEEWSNKDMGDMRDGWFASYILGYAVADVYLFKQHKVRVPQLSRYGQFCAGSYPGHSSLCNMPNGAAQTPTRWGKRFFVLKQNFLLEYASKKDVFESRPAGFLPLCGAYVLPLEGDRLAISVYGMRIPMPSGVSPIERGNKANHFQVVLGAPSASRMNIWLKILKRAAQLSENDLFTFIDLPSKENMITECGKTVSLALLDHSHSDDGDGDDGDTLAKSAFSSIHLARRRNGKHCAIKKISTPLFFKAVADKTERFDALLREVVLQGILSVKSASADHGAFRPIVPCYSVFETDEALFIEMELMSNIDLFDRISSSGVSYYLSLVQ